MRRTLWLAETSVRSGPSRDVENSLSLSLSLCPRSRSRRGDERPATAIGRGFAPGVWRWVGVARAPASGGVARHAHGTDARVHESGHFHECRLRYLRGRMASAGCLALERLTFSAVSKYVMRFRPPVTPLIRHNQDLQSGPTHNAPLRCPPLRPVVQRLGPACAHTPHRRLLQLSASRPGHHGF